MSMKFLVAGALVAASSFAAAQDAPFNATITLIQPITLSTVQDLTFAPQVAGTTVDVVTAAGDTNAAIFSATGALDAVALGSVVEPTIDMSTGAGASTAETIVVDTWSYGGSLAVDGSTVFDGTGNIADMRVGATAHVEAEDVAGDYVGSATFRLVYL